MTCDRCGARTTLPRLCRDCERDERREEETRTTRQTNYPTRVWSCSECDHVHRAEVWEGCPECGENGRHRSLGKVGGVTA